LAKRSTIACLVIDRKYSSRRRCDSHDALLALRIHHTLRNTPAIAAGVTGRVWEVSDLVTLLEASERRLEKERREL
jgi:hypothetical protein